mmetsp:Transcript_130614/g.230114  ORF Transcript_130614/g.230114 Transcript_130614/m.230114 type:complete len:105 (+) Transcript_130614:347-661(+)
MWAMKPAAPLSSCASQEMGALAPEVCQPQQVLSMRKISREMISRKATAGGRRQLNEEGQLSQPGKRPLASLPEIYPEERSRAERQRRQWTLLGRLLIAEAACVR